MKCFKALDFGGISGLGRDSEFVGKLPIGDQSGAWVEIQGPLEIDKNSLMGDHGIHLASRRWLVRYLCNELYDAEYSGETRRDGRYFVARKVRLLRRLTNWNERTSRLFAADCAADVLMVFERQRPTDLRPRTAIDVARRFANGSASQEELEVAKGAALAASEEEGLAPRAISAALAAFMAADSDQEFGSRAREAAQNAVAATRVRRQNRQRGRQARLLFGILRGQIHP